MTNSSTNKEKIKNQFKDTLNLPQTPFPMRANLAQNEPQRIQEWEKNKIYDKIQSITQTQPVFSFHDGPPYANGDIHIGHLLNKVLKDIVVRSQIRIGKHCPYTPGWDCHGLPIEHKVMSEILKNKTEKIASLEPNKQRMIIRKECEKYATKYIKLQANQMKRLLTLADYDKPYLTMSPSFESNVLTIFAKLVKEKLVYRQLKPIHWSIANQTALAEAELEYQDKEDTAIFVNFKSKNSNQKCQDLALKPKELYFSIWTTTPWTLPANLAIAIHPDYDYAIVPYNEQYLVIAAARINSLAEHLSTSLTNIKTIKGHDLIGTEYNHPFIQQTGKIVAAQYVTLEDGTGLVHTAPGHGTDDYLTGQNENLPPYCPVQEDGTYDQSVPEWLQGKLIWDANPLIVEQLKKSNCLLHEYSFIHSYPHDWRSKTPVIFRSTEQWFVSVDTPIEHNKKSLRKMALTEINEKINFIPKWGQKRLNGMIESRPDWCISRQRSWGLPIPAFKLNKTPFLTETSIIAISKVFDEDGSDAWFTQTPTQLLRYYNPKNDPDCPKNFEITHLEKLYDIFDVWFESGASWHAVMKPKGHDIPVNLYLEGSDQHRGWFHLSLLLSLGTTQNTPYKELLTHGFIVDKDGKKMSKSTGNALNVTDILNHYGAEVLRWWVSSLAFENDIKVDTSFFDQASESYRKIRNTLRFLLSNTFDYSGPKTHETLNLVLNQIDPYSIDAWVLAELSKLQKNITNAYQKYQFKEVHTQLYNFCNDTLSATYCATVKDRLYCDSPQSPRRLSTQQTMAKLILTLCELLSPILPHTSEEAYSAFTSTKSESFHAQPTIPFNYQITANWDHIMKQRQAVLKALENAKANGLENSLDCEVILPEDSRTIPFINELSDLFSVSRVKFGTQLSINDLRSEPRCERSWRRDQSVKKRSNEAWLSDRDAIALGIKKD